MNMRTPAPMNQGRPADAAIRKNLEVLGYGE
jgi:hypothetical protein